MKQKSLADKYRGQTVDNNTLNSILKDMSTGITEDVIINRYKLKKSQYLEIKTYFKSVTGPGAKKSKVIKETGIDLSKFKSKSGARKQGKNETCLCGSGKRFGSCCANK